MIINWKKINVKIIPAVKNGVVVGNVTLLPGNNEVDKDLWALARLNVLDQIKTKLCVEVATEVKVKETKLKDSKGKPTGEVKKETVITAKEFNKLSANEAEEVVADTFNLATLKKWMKKCKYDEVRTSIANKIDEVEKYGTDKKKKEGKDN